MKFPSFSRRNKNSGTYLVVAEVALGSLACLVKLLKGISQACPTAIVALPSNPGDALIFACSEHLLMWKRGPQEKSCVMKDYANFAEFYPIYLKEHANRTTRRLHVLGSSLAFGCVLELVFSGELVWLGAALIFGYGIAWISHLIFEKNRPATFRHPLYSLMGDCLMSWQILTGKIAF